MPETLSRKALLAALRQVRPEPILVPRHLLRRVIKHHYDVEGFAVGLPQRYTFVVQRETLVAALSPRELPVPVDTLPERVVLAVEPPRGRLRTTPDQELLRFYWRHLFHALIELELARHIDRGTLPPAAIRQAIDQIGQAEFDEIRSVLTDEHHLRPPRNDAEAFTEFVATYLELEHFAPVLLDYYFPAITHHDALRARLARLIDAHTLLEHARPQGATAPDLSQQRELLASASLPERDVPAPTPRKASPPHHDRLTQAARAASELGNDVRASILHMQASRFADGDAVKHARQGAEDTIGNLCERLVHALEDPHPPEVWANALQPLLEPALVGLRSAESRLLYDLQKVCLDEEEEIYAVGVVEWVLSLGQRPIKRALPSQHEVLVYKHLAHALKRAASLRVGERACNALRDLLRQAKHRAEHALRHAFRPVIRAALNEVHLTPEGPVEAVSADKLVEELLDRILERGFLTIGDLRDAISRNHLKLPDLDLKQIWRGDPLLRLNKALIQPLDGVYRPGEIYMRGLQRIQSLAFATRLGRLLVRYLILPFGGAYLILAGIEHTLGVLVELITGFHPVLTTPLEIVISGLFLAGLLHSATVRAGVERVASGLWRILKQIFWYAPLAFFAHPWVRAFFRSWALRSLWQLLLLPLLLTLPLIFTAAFFITSWTTFFVLWGALFLVANVLFNSARGRALEEASVDWLVRRWEHVKRRVIPGLIRLILDIFKSLMDSLERVLYRVDEWLRFRQGERRLALVIKGTLGTVWFFVTYLVRFYVNLLIEPQINPIKHFPVVTVSHKLMIPFLPTLAAIAAAPLAPLGPVLANTIAWATVTLLPGVFGFLVWEFKENWKLYGANRPENIQPGLVGHHGETLLRFMKPGFHSGTLPKLYRKLRRAEKRALKTGDLRAFRKHQEQLHHVAESIRFFIERELIRLLATRDLHLEVDAVKLSSNRIRIFISAPHIHPEPVTLVFEEQSGWLLAHIRQRHAWLEHLTQEQHNALEIALGGLLKKGGVDIARPQIEALIPRPLPYDVADTGLLVWSNDYQTEAHYPLARKSQEHLRRTLPEDAPESLVQILPKTLETDAVFLSLRPLPYRVWDGVWKEQGEVLPGFEDYRWMPA